MSLDERRPSFENRRLDGAYEVWFRGVHSDIGGGNHNPGLEYVTLRWMYRKAMLCGLPIIEADITDAAVHPEAPIKPNPLSKASLFWRTVNPTDRVHYSVAQHAILAGEDCHAVPPDCVIETLDNEKNQIRIG
jgi:type VI secretion system (T6SS) phospholipase Tle1-like effector